MKRLFLGAALALALSGTETTAQTARDHVPDPARAEEALERLAADYESDPMAIAGQYGVEVGGEVWTIDVTMDDDPATPGVVRVIRGEPTVPTFVYTVGPATFEEILSGRMSAYTAMAAAFESDVTPMDLRMANGFRPGPEFAERFRSFSFHFFTPGQPEIVPMGTEHSRFTHGAQAVVGYYAEGLRTAWFTIQPGQHANEDPNSQSDPWMTVLFVVEGGTGKAEVGDSTFDLVSRTMIFVPPDTKHHFWNPGDQPVEMIMVVFGKDS